MGNARVRWVLIEACQQAWKPPRISPALRARRKGVSPVLIEIADRGMNRLYQKSQRLLRVGKSRNKVKVACARELTTFVWESLQKVAA